MVHSKYSWSFAAVIATGTILAAEAHAAGPRLVKPRALERTITYDVRDMIWNGATIEEVTRGVLSFCPPNFWRQADKGGPSIRVIDGGKLEIRANAKQHQEIGEVLEALRRMADITINWEAELFEVDARRYSKEVLPALHKEKDAEALLKKYAVRVHASKRTTLSGKRVKLLSLRRPVPYVSGPRDKFEVVFPGLSFEVTGIVSADRRYVRTTVTERATELIALEKKPFYDPVSDKEIQVETPNLRETTVTNTARLEDGARWFVRVEHPTPEFRKEGRFLILAIRPTISIDAENKELFGR